MTTGGGLDRDWTAAGRTWLGALGVGLVAGSLLWLAGPPGLVVGGLVAAAWYLLPGPYAVAAGHVLALPVIGSAPAVRAVALLELGFLGILAAPTVREAGARWTLAVAALLSAVFGAIAWAGWAAWRPRWLVGLTLVGLVAVGLYGVHRYSVLTLELQGVEASP